MIRKQDAMDPAKYMGHGICDNFSKSASLPEPTSDPVIIAKNCLNILKAQKIPASDLRGIGIQMTKLCDSSSTTTSNTLMKFAQKMTVEQLHQRDRILKVICVCSSMQTVKNIACKSFWMNHSSITLLLISSDRDTIHHLLLLKMLLLIAPMNKADAPIPLP